MPRSYSRATYGWEDPNDEDAREIAILEEFTRGPARDVDFDVRPIEEIAPPPAPRDEPPLSAMPEPDEERAYHNLGAQEMGDAEARRQALEDDAIRAARDSYRDDADNDIAAVGIPALVGAFLDIGVNKGRGLGQVGAQAISIANDRARQRNANVRTISDMQLKQQASRRAAEQDAFDRQYRTRQMERWDTLDDLRARAEGRLGNAEARRAEDYDYRRTPGNDAAQRMAESLVAAGVPAAAVEGRTYDELSRMMTIFRPSADLATQPERNRLAAERAGMTERARTEAELEMAPQTSAAAADRARQIAEATEDSKSRVAAAGTQARIRAQQEAYGGESLEQQRFKAQQQDKFRTDAEGLIAIAGEMKSVDDVMARYARDKPGVGVWDSWKSGKLAGPDDLAIRAFLGSAADREKRVRSGMATTTAEEAAIERFTSAGERATEEQFQAAYGAWKAATQRAIRGKAAGREDLANEVLKAAGVDAWTGLNMGGSQRPGLRTSPHAPAETGPLGNTGGTRVRDTPRIPASPPSDLLRQLQEEDEAMGVIYE